MKRAISCLVLAVVLAGVGAVAHADVLGVLVFTPPAGWDEETSTGSRRGYTHDGKAYISISINALVAVDLPASATAEQLAKAHQIEGKVTSESATDVAGAPGYAMMYQAGQGITLIAATTAGGGTVFQIETTKAAMVEDLKVFATLVDQAELPWQGEVAVEQPVVPVAPLPTVIDAAELARLPDARARAAAEALAKAIAGDDAKAFLKLVPKKGLKIGKKKWTLKKLAAQAREGSVGGLFGWDPEAPFAIQFKKKQKKVFGLYRGSGSGVTSVVIFKKSGKAWKVAEVKVVNFGEP